MNSLILLGNLMERTRGLGRWWKKSLRALAGEHLAFSFGYLPLVSDLKKTSLGLRRLPADLKRINSHPRVITGTDVCQGEISLSFAGITGYASTAPAEPDASWWHPVYNTQAAPVRIVGVRGRNSRTFDGEGFRALDLLMSRYGGSGPVDLAWELVPFSFVLDWFVDLRPLIDSLDNALMGNNKSVDYIWQSEKWALDIQYVKHRQLAVSHAGNVTKHDWSWDNNIVGYTRLREYRRSLLLDVTPTVTASGRFGKKQGALGASLFYQNVANLRRRMR
jgi:hypothetical protein